MFSRQLAALIDAGVPILEALKVLTRQATKKPSKKLIGSIAYAVESGSSLSSSLAKYPDIFSKFYVGVVKSGEASGRLSESLDVMASYLDKNYVFTRKVRSALLYPAFVLLGVIGVVLIMFVFVMPQLAGLFADAQVDLPVSTRFLLGVSSFLGTWWHVILGVLVVLGLVARSFFRTEEGRYFAADTLLKIPVLSYLFNRIYLARLTSILDTLFRSDVPVIEVLEIAKDSIGSLVYEKILDRTIASVHDGTNISSVWKNEVYIPPLLSSMVAVGERSGRIEDSFEKSRTFFERDVEEVLESVTVFLEPLLIIMLGIGVGVVVAGVLMPIYNLVLVL